jgi:hypothetical protein
MRKLFMFDVPIFIWNVLCKITKEIANCFGELGGWVHLESLEYFIVNKQINGIPILLK